ncbi:biotin carboxylase [Pseudomonas aeruginosa]|nr:biotin carboxylase [Pseudomonas aeruginosa]
MSIPRPPNTKCRANLALARWLAEVQKLEFGGRYEPELHQRGPLYLVPTRTLVGRETAVRLGVNSDEDLLGGFVEHAFIAGKAIVHPLPRGGVAPEGWNPLFAEKVRDVVLNGVSVFSLADAHRAGARMLAEGPVRAKLAEACGGLGQYVAHDLDELDAWLGGLEERQLAQGLVLEANLESIVTHSVGQLRVNGFLLSYHGHQHQTRNARGELVYAGSDLLVARGGYAELLALDLAREVRQAIEYARIFDTAAAIFFPGCFASRRNYDIAQGRDGNGRERFGVLEQSWRVGGASSAEIAALEAFRADPGLPAVRAASFEIHEDKRLPDNSRVIYRGPRRTRRLPAQVCDDGGGMTANSERIRIGVGDDRIEGTFLSPRAKVPGVLFVHGWGGSQQRDLKARPGHRRARLRVPDLRPARPRRGKRAPGAGDARDNLQDLLAAYDRLVAHPAIDSEAIAVVGTSYGGYLAAILSQLRAVRWLALRVPAIYRDEDWLTPKLLLDREDLSEYRSSLIPAASNRALQACAGFRGDVLLVESEFDSYVPHSTIMSFRAAFQQTHSLTHRIIDHADHALSSEAAQDAYTSILVDWITEMVVGERLSITPAYATIHPAF